MKKLKLAFSGRAESAQALRDLCDGNSEEQVREWQALEKRVREGRNINNDLMEVYDLKLDKGKLHLSCLPNGLRLTCTAPTRARIQNELIQGEQRHKRHQGMASWIAMGLAIEEEQLSL